MIAVKHVFISYSRGDAKFASKLRQQLNESKLAAWRDIDDLRAGETWQQAIDDALRTAAALIVILSPPAMKSEYVTYEWAFALGAGIPVIPILWKAAQLHPRLASLHFIDFTKPGKPWLRLIDELKSRPSGQESKGLPEIRAALSLEHGQPEKVGHGYVILLSVDRAPSEATKVRYKVHDDTFNPNKWSERNPDDAFHTWMRTYGDVLLSAVIHTPTETQRIETTLFQALHHTHARSRNSAVQRALRYIQEH